VVLDMKRSPLRTLFFGVLIIFIMGLSLSLLQTQTDWFGISNLPAIPELTLARFFWSTGQIDKAIIEYEQNIQSGTSIVSNQARQELNRLLAYENNPIGKFKGEISYIAWVVPSNLYSFGTVLLLVWLILCIFRLAVKRPLFAILQIQNMSGLDIGENLPLLASDRLKEMSWHLHSIKSTTNLITESVDLPIIGMIGEDDVIDTAALVETALMLSGNSGNFPISRLLNSIKLWLEQPRYLVRGNIRKSNKDVKLQIILIDWSDYTIKHTWNVGIENNNDENDKNDVVFDVIDSFIYPLIFWFSSDIGTKRWEALKCLHMGLQEFHYFFEQDYIPHHLQRAKEYMTKALEYDSNYFLAKYDLGLLMLRNGEYESARDLFREISNSTRKVPQQLLAQYHYGVALFQMSQDWAYERAVVVFNTIIENCTDTNTEIINMAQSTLAITYARMASRESGDLEKYARLAIQSAEKVLARPKISGEIQANALAAVGLAYYSKKDYSKAISVFNTGINKKSDSLSCLMGLGEALLQIGQNEDALDAFRKAETLSPSSGYASYRLGNIYFEQGDLEQARNAYQRGSAFALARVALGKIYLKCQDYNNALEEFRRATLMNKRLGEAWINIAWTIAEMETKDPALLMEAETGARRALQLEHDRNQLWHRHAVLARILLIRGKLESSLREAVKAVNEDPSRSQSHYYLALAEYYLGQHSKAHSSLQKVIELNHDDWRIEAERLLEQIDGEQ